MKKSLNKIVIMGIIEFLKNYSFLVDLGIAFVGTLYGAIYLNGARKRRSEARYGFYINLLQFINQLKLVIDKNDSIKWLMVEEDARIFNYKPKEEIINGFRKLSRQFLSFLNSSKDIIPPFRCKCKNERWYTSLLKIVEFLQWGTMADYFHLITNENKEKIDAKFEDILSALNETETILRKQLGIKQERQQLLRNT